MSAATQEHPKSAWTGRIEDEALLRGRGRFHDDVKEPNRAIGYFLRSPHAFARIKRVETAAAKAAPGVLAVLTGADIDAAGVGNIARPVPVAGRDGAKLAVPHRPSLAGTRVMHAGEAVALVVAETLVAAMDAAELVEVDYEPLTPVTDLQAAAAPGAPQLWPEAPGNLAVDWLAPIPGGDAAQNAREVEQILASAHRVVRISAVNQRIHVASMEPRGATASFDPTSGQFTLRACSQGVTGLRDQVAGAMGIPVEKLRVTTGDVGGAFGMKSAGYPEYAALLVAARKLGRPVHWMSNRAEAFLLDNQARDNVSDMALALDAEGRFLALDVHAIAGLGAYCSSHGAFIATMNFARCFPGMYHIPRISVAVRCIFSNTAPIGPYRGAGRPEANYALERVVDAAAKATGIDPVTLRRRNLIPAAMLPYKTPFGATWDSGDFAVLFDRALKLADVAGFPERRARSAKSGKRRGLGLSCFLEHAGGVPAEGAAVVFPGGKTVEVRIATGPSGQGHGTLYRRFAAGRLGIPEAQVMIRYGDTDLGVGGGTTVASRATMTTGNAVARGIELTLEKGRRLAATLLEAAEADIEYKAGAFGVVGTDRRIDLFEVAAKAKAGPESLDTPARVEIPQSFPNGCHIAEVELDPETGTAVLASYAAVDDCGVVLDHVMVDGQIHGGVAQGVGQALLEHAYYDPASGQLIAGSFMDYAMPRADDMPMMATAAHPVPCKTNALGVKGTGEAGTTGALAAVMNAVADALPGDAGLTMDMPATPLKLWQACRETGRR